MANAYDVILLESIADPDLTDLIVNFPVMVGITNFGGQIRRQRITSPDTSFIEAAAIIFSIAISSIHTDFVGDVAFNANLTGCAAPVFITLLIIIKVASNSVTARADQSIHIGGWVNGKVVTQAKQAIAASSLAITHCV